MGVGFDGGAPGTQEAGVFCGPDTQVWRDASAWFEALLADAAVLDDVQLARAPERARDPGPRVGRHGRDDPSILGLVRGYTDDFADTLFLCEMDTLSADDVTKAEAAYAEAEAKKEFEPADRQLIVRADDGYLGTILPNVILFWHGARAEIVGYTDVVPVRTDDQVTLWGKRDWKRFRREHAIPKAVQALTAADRAFMLSITEGQWAMTAARLADALAETGFE